MPITRWSEAIEQEALEEGFVRCDAWAFEAAYTAYAPRLYGAALSVLHVRQEAEDCVHDVLVHLWRHGHAYSRARGALCAFLTVCVRNEALSRRRRDANRERIARTQLSAQNDPPADEDAVRRLDMNVAVAHLAQPAQVAIRLAYYEGLTHEQIAQRLGEPVGTIKSRLSNALRTLRTLVVRKDQ